MAARTTAKASVSSTVSILYLQKAFTEGSEEELYAEFRRVRDQIKLVFAAYAAGLRERENRNVARLI
jgi:hypothetical protein